MMFRSPLFSIKWGANWGCECAWCLCVLSNIQIEALCAVSYFPRTVLCTVPALSGKPSEYSCWNFIQIHLDPSFIPLRICIQLPVPKIHRTLQKEGWENSKSQRIQEFVVRLCLFVMLGATSYKVSTWCLNMTSRRVRWKGQNPISPNPTQN